MVAFEDPIRVREVEISSEYLEKVEHTYDILELIFRFGQNDFQPQQCCSVSVGDVIELSPANECFCAGADATEMLIDEIIGESFIHETFSPPSDWAPGLWIVCGAGFHKITAQEFEEHKALPRLDRNLNAYKLEKA